MKKLFFFALPLALVAAAAFTLTSCSSSGNNDDDDDDLTIIVGKYELSKITMYSLTFDALTFDGIYAPYYFEVTEAGRVNMYYRGDYKYQFQPNETYMTWTNWITESSTFYEYSTTTFPTGTTTTFWAGNTAAAHDAETSTSADGTKFYKHFLGETKIVDGKQCFVTDKNNYLIDGVKTFVNGEKILTEEYTEGKYYEAFTITDSGFTYETWWEPKDGSDTEYEKYVYVKK